MTAERRWIQASTTSDAVREDMTIHLVSDVGEVLELALEPASQDETMKSEAA